MVMASETEIILELIKKLGTVTDSDEFCHEALQQLASLLDTEKCSLFLARDKTSGEGRELASRLWNVSTRSTLEHALCDSKNEFVIPFEEGIAGYAAQNNTSMNVSDVYEHPEFSPKFDNMTGFTTKSILCQPLVLPADGKLIGVVEVANKKSEEPFSEEDEKVLGHFTGLCSQALQQTRRAEQITRMQHTEKLKGELAAAVANNWTTRSFDSVLKEVVLKIADAIKCQRYTLAVALVDNCNIEGRLPFAKSYDVFVKKTFDFEDEPQLNVDVKKLKKTDWEITHQLIKDVVEKRETVIKVISPVSAYKLEVSILSNLDLNAT